MLTRLQEDAEEKKASKVILVGKKELVKINEEETRKFEHTSRREVAKDQSLKVVSVLNDSNQVVVPKLDHKKVKEQVYKQPQGGWKREDAILEGTIICPLEETKVYGKSFSTIAIVK